MATTRTTDAPVAVAPKPVEQSSEAKAAMDKSNTAAKAALDAQVAADAAAVEARAAEAKAATARIEADAAVAADEKAAREDAWPTRAGTTEPTKAGAGQVVVNVPRAFNLTLDDGRVVPMPVGVYAVNTEVAEHPYAKAHGVRVMDAPKEPVAKV